MRDAAHLDFELPSDLGLMDDAVNRLSAFLNTHVEDEDLAYRALLTASEAISNAMEHGNALDAARKVFIRVEAARREVRFTVEDEGEGFDPGSVPETPADPLAEGGRGIFLMRALAEEFHVENEGRRFRLVLQAR